MASKKDKKIDYIQNFDDIVIPDDVKDEIEKNMISADLADYSKNLIANFTEGKHDALSFLDEQAYDEFLAHYKKEVSTNLVAAMHAMSVAMLNSNKLNQASLKDLVVAMEKGSQLVNSLNDKPVSKSQVDHTGSVAVYPKDTSPEEAAKRKKKIEDRMKKIAKEYSEVEEAELEAENSEEDKIVF